MAGATAGLTFMAITPEGMAPIYRGEPGYREGLDADADGVACEPYRRQ